MLRMTANYLSNLVSAKLFNNKGQGMIEYILIIALIALAIFGLVKIFGAAIGAKFTDATTTLTTP